jgi:hypothetical protein
MTWYDMYDTIYYIILYYIIYYNIVALMIIIKRLPNCRFIYLSPAAIFGPQIIELSIQTMCNKPLAPAVSFSSSQINVGCCTIFFVP